MVDIPGTSRRIQKRTIKKRIKKSRISNGASGITLLLLYLLINKIHVSRFKASGMPVIYRSLATLGCYGA